MKKVLLITLTLFCLICRVTAGETENIALDKIENSVLGITYPEQKTDTRIRRIEKLVYGQERKGKSTERIEKLTKDLNTDILDKEKWNENYTEKEYEELTADNSVDYPVIDDVEKNLKIKSTPTQTLHSRLVAIEKKLFNNVFDTDDFYTRVERIKGKVYKYSNALANDDIEIDDYSDITEDDGWNLDKILNKKRNHYSSENNIKTKLSKLEKKIFNYTYTNQNTPDRLTRLEREVFDTEFYDNDDGERLERLEGAIKGQRTAGRYDNNKFQQRLNTALQIGAMILMVLACIL